MNRGDYIHLLAERTTLQRMIDETPEEDVIDRGSLVARLEDVEAEIATVPPDQRKEWERKQ